MKNPSSLKVEPTRPGRPGVKVTLDLSAPTQGEITGAAGAAADMIRLLASGTRRTAGRLADRGAARSTHLALHAMTVTGRTLFHLATLVCRARCYVEDRWMKPGPAGRRASGPAASDKKERSS